ncbi:MAG: hypothetical protein U0Z44_13845 [Kouleothrix sp.]
MERCRRPQPGDYAWGELDQIVDDVAAKKFKLLVNIVQAPAFYNETNGLPGDPVAMGNLLDAMVKRYGKKIAAEIWNEQNLAHENGGRVTGPTPAIMSTSWSRRTTGSRRSTRSIMVLAGAPHRWRERPGDCGVGRELLSRDVSLQRWDHQEPLRRAGRPPRRFGHPPETMFPDNPSQADGWTTDPTFYFRHVENVRNFMVQEGVGDHQIWITEFGWATQNDTPGYEFGNQVSFEQQAAYITGAFKLAYEKHRYEDGSPWLGNMFLWNMTSR